MNHLQHSTRAFVAGVLATIGGALLVVGSLLTWAQLSGGETSISAQGIDASRGYMTLAVGLVALLVGLIMMNGGSRMVAVLAIVAGSLGVGVGLFEALTTKAGVLDAAAEELAPSLGASTALVREALEQLIDAGQLSVSVGIGIYVVIGGGIVALIGGIAGLRGTESEPTTTADTGRAAPSPPPAASPQADRRSV